MNTRRCTSVYVWNGQVEVHFVLCPVARALGFVQCRLTRTAQGLLQQVTAILAKSGMCVRVYGQRRAHR